MITQPPPDSTHSAIQAELEALIGTTPEEILASNAAPPADVHTASAAATVPAPYTSKLEAALDHARRGFAVFPLVPNLKIPPKEMKGWPQRATTDAAQIQAWWSETPNANIGILTTSYIVVDIDPWKGGDTTAELLARTKGFPKTLCSRSGRGGSHRIYRLPEHVFVSGGADKLGKGVDIKSWGSFIVAPGSTVKEGGYAWLNDRPVAPAPQWLIDKCKAAKKRKEGAGKVLVEEDEESIERSINYISMRAPTAEKGNRGYTAYKVGCVLYTFGVKRETCAKLIGDWSLLKCDPPMDQEDIDLAAENADKYMQDDKGARHSKAPGFECYPDIPVDEPAAPKPEVPKPVLLPQEEYEKTRAYLFRDVPVTEGPAREATALTLAAALVTQCSAEQTAELMRVWNEAACEPELDTTALQSAIDSAMGKPAALIQAEPMEGELSCSVPPDDDVFAVPQNNDSDAARLPLTESAKLPASLFFPPLVPYEPKSTPPRPWIVPGLACRGNVTMLAGPGGVAKSTWTLQVAIAAITGREDICGFKVPHRQRVAVWNQEDDDDELHRRLSAIMEAFNVSWNDLKDDRGVVRLSLRSGVEAPLVLAKRTLEGTICPTPQLRAMIESVKAQSIDLLVLDPLVELHEAGENDNVQMRCVIGYVRNIAKEGNCAVLLVAHSKKPDKARSDSFAGDMDSARGASAQVAAIRIGATIYNGGKKDATEWAFDGSHLDHVRIDIAKNNLGPKSKEPRWFRYEGVTVGGFEGESVGVLRPVALKRKGAAPAAVAAANEMLCHIAKVISQHLPLTTWHTLRDFLPHMRTEIADPLRDQKNRARIIEKAFDGADEYATDSGVLRRKAGPGTKGTLFLLAPPQPPQNKV